MEDGALLTLPAVHADNWTIAGCPVNGPAIAAAGNDAIVAWYSAANDVPKLQVARSTDAGDSFAAPVVVDEGEAVQGRPDVALDDKQAWVAWLREDASGQRSEEHTSELQSLMRISYAVFCLKKKTNKTDTRKKKPE